MQALPTCNSIRSGAAACCAPTTPRANARDAIRSRATDFDGNLVFVDCLNGSNMLPDEVSALVVAKRKSGWGFGDSVYVDPSVWHRTGKRIAYVAGNLDTIEALRPHAFGRQEEDELRGLLEQWRFDHPDVTCEIA